MQKQIVKFNRNAILSLVAAWALFDVATVPARADSPFGQTAAEIMTPDFFKGATGYSTQGSVSAAEKKEIVKKFKKEATALKLPAEISGLVSTGSILNFKTQANDFILYMGIDIYILNGPQGIAVQCCGFGEDSIAEPLKETKGINTVTKKPYFSIPNGFLKHLPNKDFYTEMQQILNTNFGTLMNIAVLNEKKLSKNAYAGKIADMPDIIFPNEKGMLHNIDSKGDSSICDYLGYRVNSLIAAKEAGEVFMPRQICKGWTIYERKIGTTDNSCGEFIVLNGKPNSKGIICAYRTLQIKNALQKLEQMQAGFHDFMYEKGVEPQTDPTGADLTAEQRLVAAWGNAFDNYMFALLQRKLDNPRHPCYQNQKVKTLDGVIGKENPRPQNFEKNQKESADMHVEKLQRHGINHGSFKNLLANNSRTR